MGVASFGLTALTRNLRGVRLIAYAGPDLDPFGVTVTIGVWEHSPTERPTRSEPESAPVPPESFHRLGTSST